jgi:hypothetical protein
MMISLKPYFICLIMGLLLASNSSMANPPPGKGNPNNPGHQKGSWEYGSPPAESVSGSVNLVAAGITLMAARDLAVNTGISGYKPLPPGVAKNLARGKPLPPGIAKQYVPGPMLARLPQHPGYEWRVVGSDLVLVGIQTAIVADVLVGVFR